MPRLAKEPGCVHVQTPRCPVALLIKSPDLYSPSQCASVSSRDFISWKWLWSDDVEYEDLEVTTESSITSVNPVKVPFQHVVHLHIFMLYTCTFLCPTPEIFMLYTRNFYVIQPRCFLATKIEFPIWMSIRHKYKYTFLVLWYGCSFDQLEFAPQINRNLTCFGSSGPYSSCGILKNVCIKKIKNVHEDEDIIWWWWWYLHSASIEHTARISLIRHHWSNPLIWWSSW